MIRSRGPRAGPWFRALGLPVVLLLLSLPPAVSHARTGEGFHVVRFADRITGSARVAVETAGLEVVAYEPHDSYIAWGSGREARQAAALRPVASVTPLPVARRVDPSIGDEGHVRVAITYRPGGGAPEAIGSLTPLGIHAGLATAAAVVPADAVPRIARHPAVLFVARAPEGIVYLDEASVQMAAGNVDEENRPVPGYGAWLEEIGLDGEGVKIGIIDSGISTLHPDLAGRVDPPSYINPQKDHGTHVAGIAGGNPGLSPAPSDRDGFVYGWGVAPGVRMLDRHPEEDIGETFRDVWRYGARVWNASWHYVSPLRGGYTAHARMVDVLSRDADPEAPGREEVLMVGAAGNDGDWGMASPHEAKNALPVGASSFGRGLVWPTTDDTDYVTTWSSRGPTADGRIYPLIAAPGHRVVSARPPEWAAQPCIAPPDSLGLYGLCSGTSMAAPHVTGAVALLEERWRRDLGGPPSPPLAKALLVNTAVDMGTPDVPNNAEGWGRLHLGRLLTVAPDLLVDQQDVLGEPGEERSYEVEVGAGEGLRVTLAWADAPAGLGADPALVNDLDLIVEQIDDEGATLGSWRGNVFSEGASITSGDPDRRNNLENVFLPEAEPGTYRIAVRAENVPGDGIPHTVDPTDQDFVLVAVAAA